MQELENRQNTGSQQENHRGWDLSSMHFILNAGEAIVAKTVRRFLEVLGQYQLLDRAMHPAWGMSETSSAVTFSSKFLLSSTTDEQKFVEVGSPVPGFAIRIVDNQNQIVKETMAGRVQVKGLSVTSGYYQNTEANQDAFTEDGWFNTGDIGFLRQGCLTITGRQKDIIIINGLNYYSHEIEATIEEIEGVEVSYTAACAVRDAESDTDKLAIFFNPAKTASDREADLLKEIRLLVVDRFGINPDYLIPVERDVIPKTAIGKIQRSKLKQRFETGEFNTIIKRVDLLLLNVNTIPSWFYRKVWQAKVPVFNLSSQTTTTLIFSDTLGLGTVLSEELEKHHQPSIQVSVGENFTKISDNHYSLVPDRAEHYQMLLEQLAQENKTIGQIVCLWEYDQYRGEVSHLEALEQSQKQGLFRLLFLAKALEQFRSEEQSVQLLWVSSYSQSIVPSDKIAYEKGTVLGLLKTIGQEMTWLNCRHIDLPVLEVEVNKAYIQQELGNFSKETEVAYRDGKRLVCGIESVNIAEEPKQ
ncbi:AMP-binding protein [Moorena sp. SIO4G3]|uniref:KR prefix domain-containing protein n=1 Tax=Moorena sp. SIO4G3 TaxID=2607821 RepID=UPI0025E1299E|nr:AMP-binding protein [Moorena sp. SIO4G3]